MKAEHLPFVRYHLRLVDHQTRNRVRLVIRQGPVHRPVQIADRHRTVHQIFARRVRPQRAFPAHHIKLIRNLAHDFLKDVFQRDQPLQAAVFIHHHREMRPAFQELAHLFIEGRRFRHEIRLHRDLHDIKPGQPARHLTIAIPDVRPHKTVHLAQQVFGVDHP